MLMYRVDKVSVVGKEYFDMFIGYPTEEELAQNMMDAGCTEEMLTCFMSCLRNGDMSGVLCLLEERRAELLCEIHREQSCIEFLEEAINGIREMSK